jgi:hypothetical protein
VRSRAEVEREQELLHARYRNIPKLKNVRVQQHKPPMVENRLLQYERVRERIAEDKRMRKLLLKQDAQRPPHGHKEHEVFWENSGLVAETPTSRQTLFDQKLAQFEKTFQQTLQHQHTERKTVRTHELLTKVISEQTRNKRRKKVSWVLFPVVGVALGIASYIGLFFVLSHMVGRLADGVVGSDQSGWNRDKVQAFAKTYQRHAVALGVLDSQVKTLQTVFGLGFVEDEAGLLRMEKQLQTLSRLLAENHTYEKQLWAALTAQQRVDGAQTTQSLMSAQQQLFQTISFFQAEFVQQADTLFSEATAKRIEPLFRTVGELRRDLTLNQELSGHLPWLLGLDGRRSIVILFANSLELRSAGGVYQSAVLLTLDRGTIADIKTFDVGALERQFQGEVTPPALFPLLTGQKNFTLRDAGWSPDFSTVAAQANVFLEKTLQQRADVVVSMDIQALAALVESAESVVLPEYDNEVVTAKNVTERLAFHAEDKVVDNDRKTYPTTLLTRLFARLSGLTNARCIRQRD